METVDRLSRSIRPFEAADEAAVAEIWHRAGRATYTYLPTWQAFTLEQARNVFREFIVPKSEIWVGTEDGDPVAYLALQDSAIDRLYVDPDAQGQGLGQALLEHAKALRPDGLELFTHQENVGARRFYEKHGFAVVRLGVSPPPESAPDVLYRWQPEPLHKTTLS